MLQEQPGSQQGWSSWGWCHLDTQEETALAPWNKSAQGGRSKSYFTEPQVASSKMEEGDFAWSPEHPSSGSKHKFPGDVRAGQWREQNVPLVGSLLAHRTGSSCLSCLPRHRWSLPGTGLTPSRLGVCMPRWLPMPPVGCCDAPWSEDGCRYFD